MDARESLREAENLRFRFQMNNRLRLECLAALSKVFRDFGEPISDEVLSSFVFALPQELMSTGGHGVTPLQQLDLSPGLPPTEPSDPPPDGDPPTDGDPPGNPPEEPPDRIFATEGPPASPRQSAEYLA